MVLSRVFALLLGTTLFVLIWTMQDGNHAAPRVMVTSELRTVIREPQAAVQTERPEESAQAANTVSREVAPATPQVADVDPSLWMFAADQPEQIAGK